MRRGLTDPAQYPQALRHEVAVETVATRSPGAGTMSGWLWLLAAGVVEIAWAQSIPPTRGRGMGAAGAVLLGVVAHHDRVMPLRVAAVLLITTGMGLAHRATAHGP